MLPWILLVCVLFFGGAGELRLLRRSNEFSIRIAGRGELMNSRAYGSEEALAELACAQLGPRAGLRMLIGGRGMGYTLAAALRRLGADAEVVVAELLPAVVIWNRGPLAAAAGEPLADPRVTVREDDVARVLAAAPRGYDAILLDVDNGPEGLTRSSNDGLYDYAGLNAAYAALRPHGMLAVWSAGPDRDFTERLCKVGFTVTEQRVRARPGNGARHVIWLARRDD